jgi:hypothetical protein
MGQCVDCPPASYTPDPEAPLYEVQSLTFNLDQVSSDNNLVYKMVFSEVDIILVPPLKFIAIANQIRVSDIIF